MMETKFETLSDSLVTPEDVILVTGASGFIGARVVDNLLARGFQSVRCLVRPSSDLTRLNRVIEARGAQNRVEFVRGNLLSRDSVRDAVDGAKVVLHLAAGTDSKSFAGAFLNSVVATRNLVEALLEQEDFRRFVNLSSFAVYSNGGGRLVDENSVVEARPESRAEAYCYAKVKQDALVEGYGEKHDFPYVTLRPGVVYGPGKHSIPGRVGIDTFGIFMDLGRGNPIPFCYVDNCADAIVLAGLKPGIEREVFNVVDDQLPTSRRFLRDYRKEVRRFASIPLPKAISFLFCLMWEKYSSWSGGQLPPVFTRREWRAYWKRCHYSNQKLKDRLGWSSRVSTKEGMRNYFASCREALHHA